MEIDRGVTKKINSHSGKYTAQQFISAIPGSGGIVSIIADRVGCAWNTARKYIDKHPTVRVAYNAECEKVLDAAESVILGKIKEKDEQIAKWYLTMKGRRRGYAQMVDTRNLDIDMSQFTLEQLKRVADGEDPIRILANTRTSGD